MLTAIVLGARLAVAAAPGDEPRREPVLIDSGWVVNQGTARAVIFSELVGVSDAGWVRIDFERAVLGAAPHDARPTLVRLTSVLDGAEQALNAEHMRQWRNMSAYFNGDAVLVEIEADPGAAASRVLITSVLAGPTGAAETICDGQDTRVLSDDPRIGRGWDEFGMAWCSAWIIDDCQKCLLAAGHCIGPPDPIVQVHFNIPFSSSTGLPQMPHPDHQYAIDLASEQRESAGIGDDWYYFGLFPNPNTGLTAYEAQGAAFTLAPAPPMAAGQTVRVTGNGSTSAPVPPEWNRIQKTGTGPYTSLDKTVLSYRVDTTSGNSGSPVILEDTGEAIGIHTHGGCTATGGANFGTAIDHPGLQAALANPRGICAVPCPPCYADCDGSGSLDFFDFLCFQNLFAAGDPQADCDASGDLDFFDFLCFQNAFAAGCP